MAIVPSRPDRSVALFVDTLEIPDEVEVEVGAGCGGVYDRLVNQKE